MISYWHKGDRVVATFEPSQYGGPGEIVRTPDDGTVLVQLDDGPAIWCEAWECEAVPDYPPDPAPEIDGQHEWPQGGGHAVGGVHDADLS